MRYKILELLKEKDGFVSGEEIGSALGVSRAAVWKNVARLKEEGYRIESVSKRGYRLIQSADALNKAEIGIENCIYYPVTDSTNLRAKAAALKEGFKDGLLVVCGRQTGGRGRLGRGWEDNGRNVCMSFVFKPDIPPVEASALTLVTGLAVTEALREYTGLEIGIKWPNDVILKGKKLCGILTEMSAEMDKINFVVTGIGINVNEDSFSEELRDKATSLILETGRKFNRAEIIRVCAKKILQYYDKFRKSGFEAFVEEYNRLCINIGKEVKAIYKSGEIKGLAAGVNCDGALLIKKEGGEEIAVNSGEVSLRLTDNKYI